MPAALAIPSDLSGAATQLTESHSMLRGVGTEQHKASPTPAGLIFYPILTHSRLLE